MKQLSLHGTALQISGSGPPVVLLHGVGLNQSMWAAQAQALEADFQVTTYDLLGHGRSASAFTNARLVDWVDQLNGVVRDLALEKFALLGFSFGGLITQAYAAQPSQMIDKLALISTVYDRSEAERAGVLARLDMVRRGGPQATIPAALSRWFSPEFSKAHPDIMNQYESLLRGNNATSFLFAYECFATADRDLVGGLAAFDRPTLVMTGELDMGSTPAMARKLAGMIPEAECSIIAGGLHMMPVEMADEVNSVLGRSLEEKKLMKKLLKAIVWVLAALVVIFIGGGYLLPDEVNLQRHTVINAPPEKVFTLVSGYKRFNEWSPWAEFDPNAVYTFEGPDSGLGAKMSWASNDPGVGAGSQTITEYVPNSRVGVDLDFGAMGKSQSYWDLKPEGAGTSATCGFKMKLEGMMDRWFGLLMDRFIGPDYDKGLAKLKALAEKEASGG